MNSIYFQKKEIKTNEKLKNLYFFSNLTEAEKADIGSYMQFDTFSAGALLEYGREQNRKIYFLINGKMKINGRHGPRFYVKHLLSDNDVFGHLAMTGTNEEEFAEMITDTETASFLVKDFYYLLRTHPSFSLSYLKILQQKLTRFEKRFEETSLHDVRLRIFNFINEWAKKEGFEENGWIYLSNTYSQEDIASILLCSRQSISYFFRKLKKLGLLKYSRRSMLLKSGFEEICRRELPDVIVQRSI